MPTQGIFEISLPSDVVYDYSIYTLAGSFVKSGKSQHARGALALDLSGFGNGLYVIRLMDQFGRRYFVKVLKEG